MKKAPACPPSTVTATTYRASFGLPRIAPGLMQVRIPGPIEVEVFRKEMSRGPVWMARIVTGQTFDGIRYSDSAQAKAAVEMRFEKQLADWKGYDSHGNEI